MPSTASPGSRRGARWRPCSATSRPSASASGRSRASRQRRAERAVFEAKERVELALDGGNLAEWHFDVEHDTLYAGDGWVRFLGHGRSPAVGKGAMLYDMMHPEDRERSRASMARALKGELEEYVDEFRVPTRAGEWKWLQARGRVVERDAEGRALRG